MNLTQTQLEAFDRFWRGLHVDGHRLDSAIAHLSPNVKAWLAELAPLILLRPVSLADALGIGVPPGEPWSLSAEERASWRPARLLVERLADTDLPRLIRDTEALAEDFPPELIETWRRDWGEQKTQELVRELGAPPPRGLRFRTIAERDAFRKEYAERLPFALRTSEISPLGLRMEGYAEVARTEEYEAGQIEMQDEGSQRMAFFALYPELFAEGLTSAPGTYVGPEAPQLWPPLSSKIRCVDACAGAGGKSLAWAAIGRGQGRIFAYDVSEPKLQALRRRAKRGGFNNIQALALPEGGERAALAKFDGTADLVLIDAPCSGWGVLRRNPDLKWRNVDEPLERLEALQARLLDAYSPLVKPGGTLVYGLCTFRPEETTAQVKAFAERHLDFVPGPGGYLGPGPCDGFFMQSFRRRGQAEA